MSEPANREAIKQELEAKYGKFKAGMPKTIFEKLPFEQRFTVKWMKLKPAIEAMMPRSYFSACVRVAQGLPNTNIWVPGPNIVTRTKARQA